MSVPSADPDSRYARGEITRDEWLRLQGSAPASAPTPPLGPPPPAGRRPLLFVVVLVVAVIAIAAGFALSLDRSSVTSWSPSYGNVRQMQVADLSSLNASATQGTAYPSNHTLWFHGMSVNLAVYGSPPDHDMAFVVQGMANPTIHVPAGARVTVTMVNMDMDTSHNWAISRNGPPYSSMPMMSSGAMMSMTMLSHASGGMYWSQSMSFTTVSGSYWYLCEYASHASSGMYGSFVVD